MNLTPTNEEDRVIVMNPASELPAIARSITADRLMSIVQQAESGDTRELFALYRDIIASDSQIQSEFAKRKSAVLGDVLNLVPWDKKLPEDVRAKDICLAVLDAKPFGTLIEWLLNATLFPVAVAEKVYTPSAGGFKLSAIVPVHYQLLDYSSGFLRIYDTDETGRPRSSSHAPDPERYIVHRGALMPVPDQWGGPMRALLVWWLLRTMSRQWWANFLERFGMPFLIGKYKAGDENGRSVLVNAFQMAVRLGALVISDKTSAELKQAAAGDSSNAHERFIELCNREISKLIVGQTLSGQASPTGELGGGTAALQGEVRDDLRKMDAKLLAVTIRSGLLEQYTRINGCTGATPLLSFGSDSTSELRAMTDLIKSLGEAGFEPDDDGMAAYSERLGFGLRRKTAPFQMGLSAEQLRPLALSADGPSGTDLAAIFSGRYKAVAELVRSSDTAEDCLAKVKQWALTADLSVPAAVVEKVLNVYAWKGATSEK